MKRANIFVYGAQYYRAPNPPRGERKRDIAQMARLGFNVVKAQAHWNWINYQPGVFDFSEIEELLDYAAQSGLGVILMSNLENAPWWVAQQHPEARYTTASGQVLVLQAVGGTPAGGWPGLCFDNEPVRQKAEEFLTNLAKKFKDHPALSYWHVWEEPHMEPTSNTGAEGYLCNYLLCCCQASLAKFRQWLKKRYGDLQGVKQAWHTRTESEQIKTPMGTTIEGKWLKEVYQPTSGKPIGAYGDGSVAAVQNNYGKGRAILFGSIVFDATANAGTLVNLIPQDCFGPVLTKPEVFARMLTTDSEAAAIVVNSQDRPLRVEITPNEVIVPEVVPDLWNETEWPVRDETIILSLKAWGVAVLLFQRK